MPEHSLDEILHPESIAVVGASTNPEARGYSFIHHSMEYGFKGKIYPVNPGYTDVLGLKVYPGIKDIPGTIDYVISCVQASRVPEMLKECGQKGVKVVHLFTARFSETGRRDAIELEQEVLRLAKSNNIRLIGPNCMGVYYPEVGLSFGSALPKESGSVGMASQTGGGASACVRLGANRGLRYSKVISYGNALDLNESDYLYYLANDPKTKVITMYIEGLKDARRFFESLRKATAVKPVIIVKGGRGKSGARAISSHTASLAGSLEIFETAVKQAGAVMARDFDEMTDLAVSFNFLPSFMGNRVGIIGGGGGPSVIAAEACEEAGFDVIPLPDEMRAEMKAKGATIWDWISNPVDVSIIGDSGITDMDILHMMGKHPNFDLLVANLNEETLVTLATTERLTRTLANLAKNYIEVTKSYGKPFLAVIGEKGLGNENYNDLVYRLTRDVISRLLAAGVPFYPSVERAARATVKVTNYYRRRNLQK
ncbi:MAG: CoA-binding protein [Dehalococcoidales bacterium]|nr:CoA-binding protein [Dehalococcoidales bacterium]